MGELFNSSIFSYGTSEELHVNLSGTDKNNMKWEAREVRKVDMPSYEKLLTDEQVVKYYYQERPWTSDEIKTQIEKWEKIFKEGQPHGALTIIDEQGNFIGYTIAGAKGKGVSEIAIALSQEYWNRGIQQSILRAILEKWGPEVRRIGLGEGFDEQNEKNQKIKKKFQCFESKELERFYTTSKPMNVHAWYMIEKLGFKPVKTGVENVEDPIDFNVKGFDLPPLDNLLSYYSKIKYSIEELYQKQDIKADKLYYMINDNNKIFTFNRASDGIIRFHYEKEVRHERTNKPIYNKL